MADLVIDARGLSCPMPIVKAKKGIDSLQKGQKLELIATDKGSVNDVQAWAKQAGHEVLSVEEKNGEYHFRIKKG
ncbi:sulfurtransferase TusA family protein [Polycladomyces sp. WAk]|uniref:Sulfurtransferase TusA family protein n=1 Tax=Polycladomyces zharkentensis TaxID=2807616 RepID=A0ABS2WJC4_9BACL|nr:sulfurtransferase TusA family protein [Polycladomyces sp. WAk]MBN2909575.1 sulfurtransferase TusA family protein [Polycladomyces sp. WAk]